MDKLKEFNDRYKEIMIELRILNAEVAKFADPIVKKLKEENDWEGLLDLAQSVPPVSCSALIYSEGYWLKKNNEQCKNKN